MQLLLVSDSHGDSQILDELVEKYVEEVDAFVEACKKGSDFLDAFFA